MKAHRLAIEFVVVLACAFAVFGALDLLGFERTLPRAIAGGTLTGVLGFVALTLLRRARRMSPERPNAPTP